MSAPNFESPTHLPPTTEQSDIIAAWDHAYAALDYAQELGLVYDSGRGDDIEVTPSPNSRAVVYFDQPELPDSRPYTGHRVRINLHQGRNLRQGEYAAECHVYEDGAVSTPLTTVTRHTRRSPDHHYAKDLIKYEHTFHPKHQARVAALILRLATKRTVALADKKVEDTITQALAAQQSYRQAVRGEK